MRRWWSFLSTAMVVVLSLSGNSLAEPVHGDRPAPGSATRPDALDALNRRVVDFEIEDFHWDRDAVSLRHRELLPKALADAVNPAKTDEIAIGALVADLFGTVNDTQLQALFTKAKTDKKAIDDKSESDRTPADKEYAAFLERVLWAGRLTKLGLPGFAMLDDVATGPKFSAFEAAFRTAFARVRASGREFHELVDKINKTTDPAERERLQKQLFERFGSVAKFLDGQVVSSERDQTAERVAETVALAIAQKNAQGHNLDLVGAGDVPLRIPLGNDPAKVGERLREARKEFAPLQNGGFGGTRVAAAPHSGNGVQTFVPGQKGTPRGPGVVADVPFDDKMKKLVNDYGCVECHGPEDQPPFFTADGALLPGKTAKRFLQALDGCGVNPFMANKAKKFREELSQPDAAADKATFEGWARANGFAVDLAATLRTPEYCRRWEGDGPPRLPRVPPSGTPPPGNNGGNGNGNGSASNGGSSSNTAELDQKVAHFASNACQLCHSKNVPGMDFFEDDGRMRASMNPRRFAKALEGCGLAEDGTMVTEIASVRRSMTATDRDALNQWARAHNLPLDLNGAFPPTAAACRKWRS